MDKVIIMVDRVKLPKLDEFMEEGKIIEWYKEEGDNVESGEPLFELETEKATATVESKSSGTLLKKLASSGESILVNETVAFVGTRDEELPEVKMEKEGEKSSTEVSKTVEKEGTEKEAKKKKEKKKIKALPAARKMAKEKGIKLKKIDGTGPEGAITKKDIKESISAEKESREEINVKSKVPLEGMRKKTAVRLTKSSKEAPHFYLTREIDMKKAAEFREEISSKIKGKTDVNLTFTDIILAGVGEALRKIPHMNATLNEENNEIKLYRDINIGLAVDTDQGLVVPVIHNIENKNLSEISSERSKLVNRARSNNLQVDEISGGTFTVTNLGMFGVSQFDAIINPPEAGILAVGEINKKPVAIDNEVEVRKRMKLTLSIDHRIVDGAVGAKFLKYLKIVLENPRKELEYNKAIHTI